MQATSTTFKFASVRYTATTGALIGSSVSASLSIGFKMVTGCVTDALHNMYVTGYEYNISTGYDYRTIKLDSALNQIWSVSFDGATHQDDESNGIAMDNSGNVYVSGNAGNNIQKWNGINWTDVGGGTSGANGQIHNLVVCNGKLYALGVFDYAGGVPANFFASWDGTDWCGVGSAFDNTLNYGCVYHDSLFIGGGFWTIDGDSILRIAKWAGGNYTDTCGFLSTGINNQQQENFSVNVFPNPATTIATFQITNSHGKKSLIIYDGLGKEIWRKETTENQIEFLTEDFAPGLYFYRIEQEGAKTCTGKLIIEK